MCQEVERTEVNEPFGLCHLCLYTAAQLALIGGELEGDHGQLLSHGKFPWDFQFFYLNFYIKFFIPLEKFTAFLEGFKTCYRIFQSEEKRRQERRKCAWKYFLSKSMDIAFYSITLYLSCPLPSTWMGLVKFWHYELSCNPALVTVWSLQ